MTFKCKENCKADCCGIVPILKSVIKQTEHLAQVKPIKIFEIGDKIVPITEDNKCIYLNRMTKKCMIYDLRSDVCKEYGTSNRLPCSYVKPDGILRTFSERKITQMMIDNTVDSAIEKIKIAT